MPLRFYKRFALNAAATFLLIVAALFGREYLYLMSAALFLIPLVSHLIGRALARGLSCERFGPTTCSEGETVTNTLTLTAVGTLPKCYLSVRDILPRWLHPFGDPLTMILQLRPGESAAVPYTFEPQKRGLYVLGPVLVTSTDPLGFYTYTQHVPCTTELVVYPAVLPLRHLFALEGAGVAGRDALDDGMRRGDGLQFHGVRDYRPGDDLRRVHWRTTARTRTLAVMEFVQGQTADVCLLLDLNQTAYQNTGDGLDSALEYAIKIAAAVASFLLRQGYHASVLAPPALAVPLDLRSPADIPRLLDTLARADATSSLTLADLFSAAPPTGALLFIAPDTALLTLPAALESARLSTARTFGIALDSASFRLTDALSPFPAPEPPFWPGLRLQTIRQGDDLSHALEGWSHARW